MKKAYLTLLLLLFSAIPLMGADKVINVSSGFNVEKVANKLENIMSANGVINVQSDFNVEETSNRLEKILKEKGMTIFSRIKHSEGATNVGIELRNTELIIFGNPKVGSPLMQCQQSVAIDLPQKALIWEDSESKVWISYNDPRYIEKRHNIIGCEEIISKMEKALYAITKKEQQNKEKYLSIDDRVDVIN